MTNGGLHRIHHHFAACGIGISNKFPLSPVGNVGMACGGLQPTFVDSYVSYGRPGRITDQNVVDLVKMVAFPVKAGF